MVPLSMLSESRVAVIREIRAGRGLNRRLAEMGLVHGARIKLIKGGPPGPVIVELNGSRLALGAGMAMKIIVEPE